MVNHTTSGESLARLVFIAVKPFWLNVKLMFKILQLKCSSTNDFSANSISWNPHKMMGAPLQCSVFLLREKGLLHEANAAAAQYLFQQDKFYDVSYDTGDKSIQCGRKVIPQII